MRSLTFSRLPSRRGVIGAALFLLVALALLAAGAASRAQGSEEEAPVEAGALMLHPRGGGADLPAVRLGTHVEVTVTGAIARTRVVQAFRNTGKDWAAATYLYPLPEDGAVDSLRMVIGQRIVVGEIRRREEAAQIYEQAKAKGQKAALVEEERPNMFVNKVANVAPGETVLIEIQYQAPVVHRGGDYSLRLPLVVGPHYVPPHTLTSGDAVADAEAVTAPILDPRHGKINPVSVEIRLQPGFPIANLMSASHRIAVEAEGEARIVRLAEGEVPADRDFVLSWRAAAADTTLGLFRERVSGADYLMAVLTPPVEDRKRPVGPREMIFVIDNSGSMAGDSMDQAKASLRHALKTLTPADRFNVIRFDDTMTELFERPVPATPEQVGIAQRFTDGLESNGGTEMLPALKEALVDDTPADSGRLRQIVFLTDGEISNEAEMLAEIGARRGRSRVFMVGIGSAPNSYLMTHMAEVGRGTYTHIGDVAEVTARMTDLLDRLARPAVTGLSARVEGGSAELTPAQLPDLYAGEPLVILARADRLEGRLEVSGTIGDKPWSKSVDLASAIEGPGVGKLWARRKVDETELAAQLGTLDDEQAEARIAQLGLGFGLVTRETSLVAVDRTPSRPKGARLTEEELPLNLPKGWDFASLFDGSGDLAPVDPSTGQTAEAMALPQTATDSAALMQGGLWLALLGLAGLLAVRRRRLV
ncbi:MAG: Ca-activated chloride channel [Sphingomonadales bacterium]|jgi:Ca-activated chloride channel family protein|nr:Ca-activated chloride channel [Sphingomonadales bacterium]